MSEARIGWGSEFHLYDGTALVELDEVTELPMPAEEADDVEVTHFKSPGKRKEYITGLIEPGTADLVVNYIPGSDTDVLLKAALDAGDARDFKIVLPDELGDPAWQITGRCIVKSRGRSVPIGDRLTQTVTVRFTGNSTEAAAA